MSIILELCESLPCYHFHHVLQCMYLLRTYVENVKHIIATSRLGVHSLLKTCIQEMPVYSLGWFTGYRNRFYEFAQDLHTNAVL